MIAKITSQTRNATMQSFQYSKRNKKISNTCSIQYTYIHFHSFFNSKNFCQQYSRTDAYLKSPILSKKACIFEFFNLIRCQIGLLLFVCALQKNILPILFHYGSPGDQLGKKTIYSSIFLF